MKRNLSRERRDKTTQAVKKRAKDAEGWPVAAKTPRKAIKVAPRPLPPAHYPVKRAALGRRQETPPVGSQTATTPALLHLGPEPIPGRPGGCGA